jgi:hypothetical protein
MKTISCFLPIICTFLSEIISFFDIKAIFITAGMIIMNAITDGSVSITFILIFIRIA